MQPILDQPQFIDTPLDEPLLEQPHLDQSHLEQPQSQPDEQAPQSTIVVEQVVHDNRESNLFIIRNNTRKRQAICAEASSKKHDRKRNKITRTFEVGDYVSVKSPV